MRAPKQELSCTYIKEYYKCFLINQYCVSIVAVSSHVPSNNHSCVLFFSIALPLLASVTLEQPNCLKMGNVVLSFIPPGNPPSYVSEEMSNFIMLSFLLMELCHSCYSTHLMANIFEFISKTHSYSEGGLIDIMVELCLTTDQI